MRRRLGNYRFAFGRVFKLWIVRDEAGQLIVLRLSLSSFRIRRLHIQMDREKQTMTAENGLHKNGPQRKDSTKYTAQKRHAEMHGMNLDCRERTAETEWTAERSTAESGLQKNKTRRWKRDSSRMADNNILQVLFKAGCLRAVEMRNGVRVLCISVRAEAKRPSCGHGACGTSLGALAPLRWPRWPFWHWSICGPFVDTVHFRSIFWKTPVMDQK